MDDCRSASPAMSGQVSRGMGPGQVTGRALGRSQALRVRGGRHFSISYCTSLPTNLLLTTYYSVLTTLRLPECG